jgi:tripartite ATP-independent transporter DctP family solute receptor
MTLTRRAFVCGVGGSLTVFSRSAGSLDVAAQQRSRADFNLTQYHNQAPDSPLHKRLVAMWAAIGKETGGRVATRVMPENNKHPGSDPAVLKMLVAGEIEFFTLMGGILGNAVPVAEVQQVPFAFRSADQAHRAMDGPLGAYLRGEMAAKGIVGFPIGAFDNGMRQIGGTKRPIARPEDLAGLRMRIPAGKMFEDTFRAFGAEPVVVNSSGIYGALKSGEVDAQENPLGYMNLFRHYEVMKFISMTNHMWSGFNMLANQAVWRRLPEDVRAVIERNVAQAVRLQRQDQQAENTTARPALAKHGLVFNEVDVAPFRARLSGVYASWRKTLGSRCWSLLEAEVGRLV